MQKRPQYQERTSWPRWVHVGVCAALSAAIIPIFEFARGNVGMGGDTLPVWAAILLIIVGVAIPALVYLFIGELRTEITDSGVLMKWGYLNLIRKEIPFSEIRNVEVVKYSPIGEFGGWGIRIAGGKKRAWTARGNRAVVFTLSDGTRFYMGSDKPERWLGWIQSTGKGKMPEANARTAGENRDQ